MSKTLYGTDENLSIPGKLTHYLSKGGLRFESHYESNLGTATFGVEWDDLAKAQAHYEDARRSVLDPAKLENVAERLRSLEPRSGEQDVSRIRTLVRTDRGKLALYTNVGPPTWWLPKVGLVKYGVKAGWLRACFVLTWSKS